MAATETSASAPARHRRRVLTVGDGNFSFSLAVAKQSRDAPLQLTATSFDSAEELAAKYPEAPRICEQLRERGATVLHRIDATNLRVSLQAASSKLEPRFDAVVFNHPHCGEENVPRHRSLLSHFYASALEVLAENDSEEDQHEENGIHLTLAAGQPERWEALERAVSAGLRLHRQIEDVDADERFGVAYDRKRHQNGKSFHHVTLHGEKKQQASTLFIFRRTRATDSSAVASAPATEQPKASRKRKAETELPLEFACANCDRSFKSAQGLRTHVHMVHELGVAAPTRVTLGCQFCDRTFKKEDARRQHQLAKHGKDPLIQPDWYQQQQTMAAASKSGSSAVEAMTPAPASPPIALETTVCSICQLSFTSTEDFDAHWQKLQPRAASKRRCTTCDREFDEERALRQHQNFCGEAPPTVE